MRIGTDSIQECIREGYLMMDYKVRELMPKGVLNPDCYVRFLQHLPEYAKEELYMDPFEKSLITDLELSTNDLWEMYLKDKVSIDSLIGETHEFPKTPQGVLSLASDINCYCGL